MARIPKLPIIEVRQRRGSTGVMKGLNTQLLINGKPLKGATGFTFEVDAKGVAHATISLIGRFKIKGKVRTKQVTNK